MMIDAQNGIYSNAVAMRKVGDTLADSVYTQILWGIEQLGVSEYWEAKVSPLRLTYKPTGQQILFRSCNNKDDYRKINQQNLKRDSVNISGMKNLTSFSVWKK